MTEDEYISYVQEKLRREFLGRPDCPSVRNEIRSVLLGELEKLSIQVGESSPLHPLVDSLATDMSKVYIEMTSGCEWIDVLGIEKRLEEDRFDEPGGLAEDKGECAKAFIRTIGEDEVELDHPEWLGVWKTTTGEVVKIVWDGSGYDFEYVKTCGRQKTSWFWKGPIEEGWEMIEPAPLEARANVMPRKTISVGWDPYGDG